MAAKKPSKSGKTAKSAKKPVKAKAKAAPRKATTPTRAKAAAALRASVQKKVGTVPAPEKPKVAPHASYQPKTEVPQHPEAPHVSASPVPHLVAMSQPWMALGFKMTLTGLTLQARMVQAAMNMATTPPAMLHGTEVLDAWLAAVRGENSKPGKD